MVTLTDIQCDSENPPKGSEWHTEAKKVSLITANGPAKAGLWRSSPGILIPVTEQKASQEQITYLKHSLRPYGINPRELFLSRIEAQKLILQSTIPRLTDDQIDIIKRKRPSLLQSGLEGFTMLDGSYLLTTMRKNPGAPDWWLIKEALRRSHKADDHLG